MIEVNLRIRKPARENSFLRQFPIFHELHSRVTQNNNFCCVSFDLFRLQKQKKKDSRDSSHTFFYFPLGYKMVSKILFRNIDYSFPFPATLSVFHSV